MLFGGERVHSRLIGACVGAASFFIAGGTPATDASGATEGVSAGAEFIAEGFPKADGAQGGPGVTGDLT